MNQDHPMTPAQSCAKEIARKAYAEGSRRYDACFQQHSTRNMALSEAVIEAFSEVLSSEVAKVHQEYQKLAVQWRKPGMYFGVGKEYEAAVEGAYKGCASAVEALAPNKEGQTHE